MPSSSHTNDGRISPPEFDLTRAASSPELQSEPMLETLVRLARVRGGPRPAIYVIVSGTLIVGVLGPDAAAAQQIDENLLSLAERGLKESPEDKSGWESLISNLQEGFLGTVVARQDREREELRREVDEHVGEAPYRIGELPEHLARRMVQDQAHEAFTLLDAQISTAAGGSYLVPIVRIRTADVSVWWIAPQAPEQSE